MFESPAGTIFVILAIAFVAPVIATRFPRLRLPSLVLEIVLGIIVGPEVLDLVDITPTIELFGNLGLATLIFLAGFELDIERVAGRPFRLALSGWALSVVLAVAVAGVLLATGVTKSELYVSLALTTTALGTLLPVLGDTGLIATPFGSHVLATGSVGEFLPIVATTLLLSGSSAGVEALALLGFAVISVLLVAVAMRGGAGHVRTQLARTLRSSGQLSVRLAMLLITALAFVAAELGLDFLLGAFMAGIVYRLYVSAGVEDEHLDAMESKIEAVSYGLLVPVFFVITGLQYDLSSLASFGALAKLPLFVAALLLVRGLPVFLLYRRDLPTKRERWSLACFDATGLPLIVAITTIGVATGHMRSSTAAALVGAGMISVILFPLVATMLIGRPAVASDL
jgi:Kef-type K+ transport system membrane component KefB